MGTKELHLRRALALRALAEECRRLAKGAADEVAERFYRHRASEYEAIAEEEEKFARKLL